MYRHILVTLDSVGHSEQILTQLQSLVRQPASTVRLLSVYPSMHTVVVGQHTIVYADQLESQASAEALVYLDTVASRLRKRGFAVTTEVSFGEPVERILTTAQTADIDLIVMPVPWCRGDGRLMTGEVTAQVIRKAPVPVLVMRLEASPAPKGGRLWTSRR